MLWLALQDSCFGQELLAEVRESSRSRARIQDGMKENARVFRSVALESELWLSLQECRHITSNLARTYCVELELMFTLWAFSCHTYVL